MPKYYVTLRSDPEFPDQVPPFLKPGGFVIVEVDNETDARLFGADLAGILFNGVYNEDEWKRIRSGYKQFAQFKVSLGTFE